MDFITRRLTTWTLPAACLLALACPGPATAQFLPFSGYTTTNQQPAMWVDQYGMGGAALFRALNPQSQTPALEGFTTGNYGYGLWGESDGTDGVGLVAIADYGYGANAIYARSYDGYAAYLAGPVYVSGDLNVGGSKNFRIDDPLDPANKYLVHAAVESSERSNIYSGNVALDSAGSADVSLPNWFEALNGDFRYQLTCIGGYAPVYIADEIHSGHFRIAGGKPGLKVSWQVTGVRQDAYSKAHPLVVEQMKPAGERGTYQHPVEHGAPASLMLDNVVLHRGAQNTNLPVKPAAKP